VSEIITNLIPSDGFTKDAKKVRNINNGGAGTYWNRMNFP